MQPFLRPEEALALHLAMLEDSLALLRLVSGRTGARPVLAMSEDWDPDDHREFPARAVAARGIARRPQRGGDLGERLRNTLGGLRGSGESACVIFGSDSPTVPVVWLESACETLTDRSGIILGPARDGGYYLVGARGGPTEMFEGIDWGTDRVLRQTLRTLKRGGYTPALLPPWYDIDEPGDLRTAWHDLATISGFGPLRTGALIDELISTGRLP